MTDTAHHDRDGARSVFAGLVPNVRAEEPRRDRSRVTKGVFSTVPILLVGSMAAMTFNLTGPVEPVDAKPIKPKGDTSNLGKTLRSVGAAAASVVSAPVTTTSVDAPSMYRVSAGDTISDIAGRYGLSTASVLALNGLGWSSLIFPGQQLKLTTDGSIPDLVPAEAPAPSGRYTIISGDTISGIAAQFGVSTLSILSANGLGWSSIIYPGQTLAIPGVADLSAEQVPPAPEETATVQETLIAEPIVEVVVEAAPPVVEEPVPAPAPVISASHTVAAGDTLSGIAARYGISTQSILDANSMSWESMIFPGDKLVIPGVATVSAASSGSSLNDEMRANAAVIVQVGREIGVPDYGIVIALATAMQESSMRNLSWGDRDSVGLFQQRPSSGWGSVEQLTTPRHAALLFYGGPTNPNRGYTRGLLDISGWQSMPLTVAAQKVQISAYPDAYAKWEESARAWLAELG